MTDITAGKLLISEPFLKDPNFLRSVVFLCEHDTEGSLGFVINKLYDEKLGELMPDLEGIKFPVYYGGPVQINTLHFLHRRPELIEDGVAIVDGIYWGGNFEQAIDYLKEGLINENDIRFFIGYSGWEKEQLQNEFDEKTWIVHRASSKLVFHKNVNAVWKDALLDIGGEYATLVNYPIDPQLN